MLGNEYYIGCVWCISGETTLFSDELVHQLHNTICTLMTLALSTVSFCYYSTLLLSHHVIVSHALYQCSTELFSYRPFVHYIISPVYPLCPGVILLKVYSSSSIFILPRLYQIGRVPLPHTILCVCIHVVKLSDLIPTPTFSSTGGVATNIGVVLCGVALLRANYLSTSLTLKEVSSGCIFLLLIFLLPLVVALFHHVDYWAVSAGSITSLRCPHSHLSHSTHYCPFG